LYADADKRIVNMIVEIPRWSNAKFEVKNKNKKKTERNTDQQPNAYTIP
jgi:inorganic pyrophosphatase